MAEKVVPGPLTEVAGAEDEKVEVAFINASMTPEKKEAVDEMARSIGITSVRLVNRLLDVKLAEYEAWKARRDEEVKAAQVEA